MANYRLILSFIDYTPTASSEDPSFLATNLKLYGNLFRPYKALVQSAIVDVTLDFGIGNTLSGLVADPAIFLDDLNITSAHIQGNSVTTNWVTPPWDQAITIGQQQDDLRYKGFFRLADLNAAAFAYRYLNLHILSQAGTDGGVYRIGRAAVGNVTELLVNPSADDDVTLHDPKKMNDFDGGGFEVLELGNRYTECLLPRSLFSAAHRTQDATINALSPGRRFVLWKPTFGNSQDAWMFQRMNDPSYKTKSYNVYDSRWEFREVL